MNLRQFKSYRITSCLFLAVTLAGLSGCSSNYLPSSQQNALFKAGIRDCPPGGVLVGESGQNPLAQWCSIRTKDDRSDTKIFKGEVKADCTKKYVLDASEHWVADGISHDCDENTGHIIASGTYDHGKRVGSWEFFHSDGKKESKGSFRAGNQAGEWSTWDQDGRLIAHEFFTPERKYPIPNQSSYFTSKGERRPQKDFFLEKCKLEGDRCVELYDLLIDTKQDMKSVRGTFYELCQMKIKDKPNTGACYFKGKTFFALKQYAEAAVVFAEFCNERSLRMCSDYGSALFHSGKRAEGLALLEKYIRAKKLEESCAAGKGGDCYNVACFYSLKAANGDSSAGQQAESFLKLAVKKKHEFDWDWAQTDPDMEFLRNNHVLQKVRDLEALRKIQVIETVEPHITKTK